ncbi:MAG TPA: indole-3-glycerol phosphate synthase TrpC [Longimicrobiales bacterium]|nr:indole-3-glycerol phosphate synthase TrpC [Longimicrobiales bacterium]
MMSVLDRIVETKRAEVAALAPRAAELRRAAESAGQTRRFSDALRLGDRVAVIAEVKRRSPSAGWIRPDATAAEVAGWYEAAGASAISVLTDGEYFGGSLDDLMAVRSRVGVPVLRKDFVLDAVQLWEARAAGADAVLLIVRILDDAALADLLSLSRELGLSALVEVHDERELDRALEAGAEVVGVNNRDLATFRTDLAVTERLAARVPADRILVAESGIRAAADVDRMGAAGADAVLVGESLMRESDPGLAARALVGRPRTGRLGVAVPGGVRPE